MSEPELSHIYNPEDTKLHEMVEQLNSVDPEYMRTGKPRIEDIPDFADRSWVRERTEAGELPNPRVEMREYKPEPKNLTPEQMAEQMGVPVEKVGEALQAQIEHYVQASQRLVNAFAPPKMNRAQRRAQAKARRRSGRG